MNAHHFNQRRLAHRAAIIIGIVLLLGGCLADAGSGASSLNQGFPRQLHIPGFDSEGIFDPSMIKDPNSSTLWMSYTHVQHVPVSGTTVRLLHIRLATSEDNGATWTDAGVQISESDVSPNQPQEFRGLTAAWKQEVSRLMFDPGAPVEKRWKLAWHRYLWVNDPASSEKRKAQYGWIALKEASSPLALAQAPEQKLFVGKAYDLITDQAFTRSVLGEPLIRLWQTHPELDECVAFTEPGLLAKADALYMSLICLTGFDGKVILVKLNHSNEAWSYVTTVMTASDAQLIDSSYINFSASEMFAVGDTDYLMVSPNALPNRLYNGCLIFRFEDFASGQLTDEDNDQLPDVVQRLQSHQGGINKGACAYAESSTNSGIIIGEIFPVGLPFARLYMTGVNLFD